MWPHVVPGEPIKHRWSAQLENAKRDAANAEQRRQSGDEMARPDRRREADMVRIENLTGQVLQRGDIVGLGAPVIAPAASLDAWWHRPVFQGELPVWTPQWKHPGRFAIMLEPCDVNKVASAIVSGCGHARVLIRDINHEYADVDLSGGGVRLTSTDAGSAPVQILAIEASTSPAGSCGAGSDVRWAYVRIQNGGQFTLVGKVVTANIAPFDCWTLTPPRGAVQVYYLDPTTVTLTAVTDRAGNAIYVCPYTFECREVCIGEWVMLHCDRWNTWWLRAQEPVRTMLKATECIYPGETGKYATVMRQGNTGWEVDPCYTSPVPVDNRNCLIFALPGELFSAYRDCCFTDWVPDAQHGLTRRVKIAAEIDCDDCGEVTVMTGEDGCLTTESICPINACNTSNRKLACDADEYATMHLPGHCTTTPTCYGWLVPNKRPLRATAVLTAPLCGTTAAISGITYKDVCDWTPRVEPTTAANPLNLYACEGRTIELGWDEATCAWEVTGVPDEVLPDWILGLRCIEDDEICEIEKETREYPMYGHTCVCDSGTIWDTALQGERVTLVTEITNPDAEEIALTVLTDADCVSEMCQLSFARTSVTTGNAVVKRKSYCLFCANEQDADDDDGPTIMQVGVGAAPATITGSVVDVVTGLEIQAAAGYEPCKLIAHTAAICVLCGVENGQDAELEMTAVDALTEADFTCDPCPALGVKTTTLYAFCVGTESASDESGCECVDCEEYY